MGGEIARGIGALISLVMLGLTFGFSPPLYGITLHLLARNGSPRRAILSLTTGMVLSATLLLLAFRTFDPSALAHELSLQVEHLLVQTVVDLVAGGLLVIGGFLFAWLSRRPVAVSGGVPAHQRGRTEHPQAMIGVGFANTAIGVAPPVTMYITGRVIAGATTHLTLQFAAYAVFLAAVVAPYLGAAYAWRRIPGVSTRVTRVWARLMRLDLRRYIAWGLVIAGIVFLVIGIVGALT